MKVITDSICLQCKHFEHVCGDLMQQEEYHCIETCIHPERGIQERFVDEHEINECEGFFEES